MNAKENLSRLVVDHRGDRLDGHAIAKRGAQIDQENREAVGALFDLLQRCGTR